MKRVYNYTKKVGTPTMYNATILNKAKKYIETCEDEEREFHKTRGEKSDSYERYLKVNLPTKDGLALYLGVSPCSIDRWEEKYPEFGAVTKEIARKRKQVLLEKGLSGEYNPVIAKLLLSSMHGMREIADVHHVVEQTLTPEQEKRLLKLIE